MKDSQGFRPKEKASNSSNLSSTPTPFKGSYRIFTHRLIHGKVLSIKIMTTMEPNLFWDAWTNSLLNSKNSHAPWTFFFLNH